MSRQTKLMLVGAILLTAGVCGAYYYFQSGPPTPAAVKAQVQRYLQQQSGKSEFTLALDLDQLAEVATLHDAYAAERRNYSRLVTRSLETRTNLARLKDSVAALRQATHAPKPTGELAAQEKKLAAQTKDYESQRQQLAAVRKTYDGLKQKLDEQEAAGVRAPQALAQEFQSKINTASDYRSLYHLIGQQLDLGDRLLARTNQSQQLAGLALLLDASRAAGAGGAEDDWLTARICEGYLWPAVSLVESNRHSAWMLDNALRTCGLVFRQVDETNNLVRNHRLTIAMATDPYTADMSRYYLARHLETRGEVVEALTLLKEIREARAQAYARRRIPALENAVKQAR